MKNLSKKLGILIVAVIAFFSITVGALQLSMPVKADAIVETTNVITLLDKVQVRFPNTGKEMGMRFVFTVDDAEYDKLTRLRFLRHKRRLNLHLDNGGVQHFFSDNSVHDST